LAANAFFHFFFGDFFMRNFVQRGDTLPLVAPYAVASGGLFKVGAIVAVAVNAAVQGGEVEGLRLGVFSVPKAPAQAWVVGDDIFWDDTAKVITTTATSNTLVGVVVEAATSSATTGTVLLDGTIR
jgi:predicted RecA/RadA family phage recombinase